MSSGNSSPSSSRSPSPAAAEQSGSPMPPGPISVVSTAEVPEQLKKDLKEYLDLQKQIKEANEELKVFKEHLKELSNDISQYMFEHGVTAYDTPLGKVSFYQSKSMKPLNKEFVKETFQSKISDKALAEELTTIFEKRPFTEVSRIKIFPPKRSGRGD